MFSGQAAIVMAFILGFAGMYVGLPNGLSVLVAALPLVGFMYKEPA